MRVATITIVFHTSSKNVEIQFFIDENDQKVGSANGTIVKDEIAPGQYLIRQTISTVDGSVTGGEWCETTISEAGQPGTVFSIPKELNTISMGQSSDTASGTLTVV
jgi:hypothetical protein